MEAIPDKTFVLFRQNLRTLRQEAGLSQIALAERMGIASSWISELETGSRGGLTLASVGRFVDALELTPDLLLRDPADTLLA